MTDTAQGPRWIDYLPLDELVEADRNPKGHEAAVIEASFRRFGMVETPTLDERTGKMVGGHGRKHELERALAAGEDPPDGVLVDADGRWLVPVERGWASKDDDEAAAYVITSNQATIAGGWTADLGPYLDELAASSPDALVGVGFGRDDIDAMLAELHTPEFAPVSEDEQPRLDVRNPVVCPACGHSFHRV